MIRIAVTFQLLVCAALTAQTITVTNGKKESACVLVRAKLPKDAKANLNFVSNGEDRAAHAELGQIGLAHPKDDTDYFTFLLPQLKPAEVCELKTEFNIGPQSADLATTMKYRFEEKQGEHLDVVKDNHTLLRFVYTHRTEKEHDLTFKPFHQIFMPGEDAEMDINITSGAHPKTKEFLYPHHRGLFYGFNKITYGDKQEADIWHGTDNVYSQCESVVFENFKMSSSRHFALISWHGKDGKTFAGEQREVTVYKMPGEPDGLLIDWISELTTKLDTVTLDGDPQHAGFHFRAAQDVAAASEAEKELAKKEKREPKPASTYYIRPDGQGKPGETRNWDEKTKDPKTINVPWTACSFVTSGKRYTVLRMVHPDNPKETRGSERDYGRFGDCFKYELTPRQPLKVQYRLWVQPGEMTQQQCEALYNGYTQAVDVNVTKPRG